ncbi:MAG: acyl-CoA dehydrogenase family protein [Deltaproteobacteria bacterium]|nr:acyl-CoA dehydrogenase family protein [Deltaproteobacteria bacterium]MBW2009184.1 acyl-CoA dehydrogenase family protein [Deltaproteobacteria bacterium]MBW2102581.1 acyl-CoA dehydrogenase family protein [Deltaproteobacteria bacterium]MBW2348422.1 acyl-CoA dehydrogenase family protein [Deltaproteobacteria bacterium]
MDTYFKEEHLIFQEQIRRFCETEMAPLVDEAERTQTFPRHLFRRMGELGYLCIRYPEKYGGAGADKITECVLREEISRVCQGFASSLSAHSHLSTFPIYRTGTEDQKREYLIPAVKGEKIGSFALTEPDAGSDTKSIRSTAVRKGDHYVLRGSKTFITNSPFADYLLTAAYTDKGRGYHGISLFLVDKGTPGMTIRKLEKEGIRSSDTGEVSFEDCPIPADHLLGEREGTFKLIMETLSEGRIGVSANMVGVAQAAYEAALRYARERTQFGRPIGKFQAVAHKLADMATRIRAARLMVYSAAHLLDRGKPCTMEASAAKLFSSETAVEVAREAIQIHGGYGVMSEYPVSRYLRDALVYTIGEGTSEIQRNIIAKQIGL